MGKKQEVSKFLNDNKDEILSMRENGVQAKVIADKFNLPVQTILGFCNRNGVRIRGNKNDKNIIKEIISMYDKDNIPMKDIATKFHFSQGTIHSILVDNNIHIKDMSESKMTYSLNKHYFSEIDTPNKAYILGLLYTDGNISSTSNTISISLQERDKDILEKISIELDSNRPLHYINYENCELNRQNQWKLQISNKVMAEDLKKHGLIPNKSAVIKFPDFLRDELLNHFIRGAWDGDGHISDREGCSERRASFVGTYSMCSTIKNIIESKLDIHCSISHDARKKMELYSISIAGRKQVKKLLDWLYSDADLYLNRKHDTYLKFYTN